MESRVPILALINYKQRAINDQLTGNVQIGNLEIRNGRIRNVRFEWHLLVTIASVQVVTGKTISPTMVVDVEVEGVLVSTVVDTGSQSTIVSQPFLHKVKRHFWRARVKVCPS